MKVVFIKPHTDQWVSARLGAFTSSESSKLLIGGKRKMTPAELAAKKANDKAKKAADKDYKADARTTVDTLFGDGALTYINIKAAEIINKKPKAGPRGDAIDWGLAKEPEALAMYTKVTGRKFNAEQGFIKINNFFGGTPDGCIGLRKIYGIVEVKCPHAGENHVEMCKLKTAQDLYEYSLEYYTQCQMNMLATGAKWCDFISFDPRTMYDEDTGEFNPEREFFSIKILRVPRNEVFLKDLEYRLGEAAVVLAETIKQLIKNQIKNRRQYERRVKKAA